MAANKPAPYQFREDLPPFEQELHILKYFEENFTDNPKKLLAMGRRLAPMHPEFIQISLFKTLACTKDPVAWMRRCFEEAKQYPMIMKQYMEEGHHGMLMQKVNTYPFSLKTNPRWLSKKESEKWTDEQERELVDEVLFAWLKDNRERTFSGRIVFFRDFGFSGISYQVDHIVSNKVWDLWNAEWEKEDLRAYMQLAMEKDDGKG